MFALTVSYVYKNTFLIPLHEKKILLSLDLHRVLVDH